MLTNEQLRQAEAAAQEFLEDEDYNAFIDQKASTPLRIYKTDSRLTERLEFSYNREAETPNLGDTVPLAVTIEYKNPLMIRLLATYAWLKIRNNIDTDPEFLPLTQTIFGFNTSAINSTFDEKYIVAVTLAMVLPCYEFIGDIEKNGGVDYDQLAEDYQVDKNAIRMRIINLQVMGELS
jgi:hypothetical protein